MSTSIVDYALAAADQGLRVFPIVPLGKVPQIKGWQEAATTDPQQILEWFRQWPNANYGMPTGLSNNLLVVDADGAPAIEWWEQRGFDTPAIVTTPRGGRHFVFRLTDAEVQSNQGKLFKVDGSQVDIRGEGGLVVGPGSMTAYGYYAGDLKAIANAPEASEELIAFLPEKQTYEYTPYDGPQAEVASHGEQRQVAHIVEWLRALPAIWHEGAGWHDTVFRSACWLSRMVNSAAYAIGEDEALSILMTHTPVYPGWGQDKIHEQWVSARGLTHGQYAEAPDENDTPPLLPFIEVGNLLPEHTTGGEIFTDLLFQVPEDSTPGGLWNARRYLIAESFRAGLTPEQTATVVWNAKVASDLQADLNGLSRLWGEVEKGRAGFASDSGEGIEPPPSAERTPTAGPERFQILTDAERDWVRNRAWWGTRYLDWVATRVGIMNAPYHRMNRWTILSLVFSPYGFIPKNKGPMGLNLFQMVLGKTTTGKTEALELMRSVLKACYPKGESPDIGGDASPNSLIEKLIERDGKSSWFNADEAHGLFKEMQGVTWRTGLREKWTHLYDGRVPMMLRAGKKDYSGIDASTHFVMHLMGTTEGMVEVLDAEFWTSGFLARYVWAIGEEKQVDLDMLTEDQQEGDVVRAYEAMPKQYAAEFEAAKRKLLQGGSAPRPMMMEQDALDRHTAFKVLMARSFAGHPHEELVKPTTTRFANNIRKCATLVAMVEGSPTVTLEHELIALEQAEEWLGNILWIVSQTTATGFSRQVDEVERFVAGQRGQEVRIERVYSRFPQKKRDVDEYIAQLVAEGRVSKLPAPGDSQILRLKGSRAA